MADKDEENRRIIGSLSTAKTYSRDILPGRGGSLLAQSLDPFLHRYR